MGGGGEGGDSSSHQSRTFQREPGLGERLGAGGGSLSADMPGVPKGDRGLDQGGNFPWPVPDPTATLFYRDSGTLQWVVQRTPVFGMEYRRKVCSCVA